jgi:hypothetical protein
MIGKRSKKETCNQFLADKAFDPDRVRNGLIQQKIEPVTPPRLNHRFLAKFDRDT